MGKQTSIIRFYIIQTNSGRAYINLIMVRGNRALGKGVGGRLAFFFNLYTFYHHFEFLSFINTTYSKQSEFFTMPMYCLFEIME